MSMMICSVEGCKRAVACLCRHCQANVCVKHFNEHQNQVNEQLIPFTDRLNELRMKVQFDLQMVPLVELASCREKKHQQIDREYEQKLREFRQALAEQETQISQTVSLVEDLVKENDASLDQVNQLRRTIHQLAKQVNQLLTRPVVDQEDLLGTTVLMAGQRYLVKARIKCQNTDLFALESERPFESYNGLCPKCGVAHVSMQPKRGFYALSSSLLCGFRS